MRRKKVLLVDDSATVLLTTRTILARNAYEIVTARDGVEGLEKARAERPDLILMDGLMPRMDGFEACRRLREAEETRAIPVILVTTRDELEGAGAGGWAAHVTKPINGVELLAKVRGCLGP